MKMALGLKGWFTPYDGTLETRQRAEVIHVWSDTCANLRLADGTEKTSVLLKLTGAIGNVFEPDNVDSTEQMIRDKGADVAPRITKDDIEANIIDEVFFTAEQGYSRAMADLYPDSAAAGNTFPHSGLRLMTFCVLTLRNGFYVTGEFAVASPENFNAEVGRKIARDNAINKIWPLMGYELRSKLAAG